MPDFATYLIADETAMEMPFGKIILRCNRENVDLSRLGSRGGMPYLSGHDVDMPLGVFQAIEVKNGRVEGTAQLIPTQRNAPYIEEVKSGVRPGCSPAFLLDFDSITALEDPDNRDGFIGVINSWTMYEGSAVTTPRNQNAGLIGIRDRSAGRASTASIKQPEEHVELDPSDAADVAALERKISEVRAQMASTNERQEKRAEKRQELNMQFSQLKDLHTNTNGQAEREPTASSPVKEALASMLFGGPEPHGKGVLDVVGQPGRLSTVKLSFDTTSRHGAVTTEGGARAADDFFESGPARILALPRRLENLMGDQQVPVLQSEPTSSMVAQNAARLAVVDATLASTPPTLTPRRLQTVADITLETTAVSPGFEGVLLAGCGKRGSL